MRILDNSCGYPPVFRDFWRNSPKFWTFLAVTRQIFQISSRFHADSMRIPCGFHADSMRILCGFLWVSSHSWQLRPKLRSSTLVDSGGGAALPELTPAAKILWSDAWRCLEILGDPQSSISQLVAILAPFIGHEGGTRPSDYLLERSSWNVAASGVARSVSLIASNTNLPEQRCQQTNKSARHLAPIPTKPTYLVSTTKPIKHNHFDWITRSIIVCALLRFTRRLS